MATKTKKLNKKFEAELSSVEPMVPTVEPVKATAKYGKLMSFGWLLLLLGGLGHMLPEQMAPVLKWAVAGVTMQTAVGVLSVILALYYLLEE
jgi:hypothetical protein